MMPEYYNTSDLWLLAHITNGRDPGGVEHTLCGLRIKPEEAEDVLRKQQDSARAGRWCQTCVERDA